MAQNDTECIILAGGLGTRLRSVIGGVPKCMAPVAGRPFLHYLFQYLAVQQTASRVVLSLGYRSEAVIEWLSNRDWPFQIDWVIEEQPLGTGGGICLAMAACKAQDVFVCNGDTMFMADADAMLKAHSSHNAETTIALKAMNHFERYGTVVTNEQDVIISFEEKAPRAHGDINGGVYLIRRETFMQRVFPRQFSFEKEYLERKVAERRFYGWRSDAYFIDIGVPADYERAAQDFKVIFAGA